MHKCLNVGEIRVARKGRTNWDIDFRTPVTCGIETVINERGKTYKRKNHVYEVFVQKEVADRSMLQQGRRKATLPCGYDLYNRFLF